jgi:hypothetical protein
MSSKKTLEEEIGCWDCAVEGAKSGKLVCPDCGTDRARFCNKYRHERIQRTARTSYPSAQTRC